MTAISRDDSFVLSGLSSRMGLSNWAFFFRRNELVRIDVGVMPAVVGGIQAGIGVQFRSYGPERGRDESDDEWLYELSRDAKSVLRVPDHAIERVRIDLRLMAHELLLTVDGKTELYGIMNRRIVEPAIPALATRFGDRFEVARSGPYAWLEAKAPFLVR